MKQHEVLSRRDQVVVENLPLVKAIALRLRSNLPVHVDLDDLMSAGTIGLIDAATKFDEGKEVTFHIYAKHRIKGAMLDSLRQADWASREMRRRQKKLETVTRELSEELDRKPEDSEVAHKMGVSVDRWRQMAVDMKAVSVISASSRPDEDNTLIPDFPAPDNCRPDKACEQFELSAKLTVAIGTLPERYQKVVFMYYSQEMTMKEIGSKMRINESRVSQIHTASLHKLAGALTSVGIETSAALV